MYACIFYPCFKEINDIKHDNCSKIISEKLLLLHHTYKVIRVLLILVNLDGILSVIRLVQK